MAVSSQQKKINAMKTKYELDEKDFWVLPQNKNVRILYHDACERIANIEGVRHEKPEWLSKGENGVWVVQASGFLKDDPDNVVWTTGEATKENVTNKKYIVSMAEKRAKDRLILKLVQASEFGIKSEDEAEAFANPEKDEQIAELQQQVKDLVSSGITRSAVDKPAVKQSSEPKKVADKASGNGKELISSLYERKKAWTELTVEAKNRNKGSTEVDGKNVDTWKVKVREKLEDMYGPERSWTEKTPPASTFEATELYAAYTELFPDLVDEE